MAAPPLACPAQANQPPRAPQYNSAQEQERMRVTNNMARFQQALLDAKMHRQEMRGREIPFYYYPVDKGIPASHLNWWDFHPRVTTHARLVYAIDHDVQMGDRGEERLRFAEVWYLPEVADGSLLVRDLDPRFARDTFVRPEWLAAKPQGEVDAMLDALSGRVDPMEWPEPSPDGGGASAWPDVTPPLAA